MSITRCAGYLFVWVLAFGPVLCDAMENRVVLTMNNFMDMRIDMQHADTVVILWPSSDHPVLVTSNNESVQWNPIKTYTAAPFPVIVDYASKNTTFTVPGGGFSQKLYYFCENHESMGIHEMFVNVSDLIDINKTVGTVEITNSTSSGAVLWSRDMVLVIIFVGTAIGILSIYALYHATAEKKVPESHLVTPPGPNSEYEKVPINPA